MSLPLNLEEGDTVDFDLLEHVQAAEGFFAVLGLKGESRRQKLVATRQEFNHEVEKLKNIGYDVYFGVSKFATESNRTKDNVLNTKCVWVDLDCGPTKGVIKEGSDRPEGYLSQEDALTALKGFCKETGLPKPTLVDSGYGIHAYWALDKALTRSDWEPLAERFRSVCMARGLYVDAKVFEAARVLRPLGTTNFKFGTQKEVRLLCQGGVITVNALWDLLGGKPEVQYAPKRELSELQKSLLDNASFNFGKIMRRGEDGCKQLLNQFLNQVAVTEPMWFDALSIAQRCVDRDTAIHKISDKHPDYDYATTETKANNTQYPHTCATFELSNPGGCEGCVWRGKIKTPLSLGKVIEESPVPVVEVNEAIDDGPVIRELVVPKYPFPFFRGKNGGVYVKSSEEEEAICIYEHDLYVVNRMFDPNPEVGELVVLRHKLPHDDMKEFNLKLSTISNKELLKDALARQGVAALPKKFDAILNYIMLSNKELQCIRRAEQMRTQFGWADRDNKFIIGTQEITAKEVNYSPPSSLTKERAEWLTQKGSLQKWKEIFDLYNQPGLEPHAFAALTAFGAPLLKFTGHSGAIINLIHKSSGTGKSTVLAMCNSVYGHPTQLMSIWKDTLAARMIKLGIMNNLPFTVDEVTNMAAADFSTMVYSMSQGRGPDRVKSSANELRSNTTAWQTISLASSNASFYDKLMVHKSSPDGEVMRLIEYEIEPSHVIEHSLAKRMFDLELKENYGHAGPIYIQHILSNLEDTIKGIVIMQERIDRDMHFSNRERFWSAVAACNMAGGIIAKRIGLIDWDFARIYDWMKQMLNGVREDTKAPAHSDLSIIGEYLNANINNMLVVNDAADKRSGLSELPLLSPRGVLNVRYEPDTKYLYIATKPFKKFCVDNQISFTNLSKTLRSYDEYRGVTTKRLGKGLNGATVPVSSMLINCREDGAFGEFAEHIERVEVRDEELS